MRKTLENGKTSLVHELIEYCENDHFTKPFPYSMQSWSKFPSSFLTEIENKNYLKTHIDTEKTPHS